MKDRVILRIDEETAAFLSTIKNKSAFVREAIRAKAEAEAKAPKKFPLSEIIKDPNKVIHCPTSEEAKALCKELGKRGLKWNDGSSYSRKNNYSFSGSNTCYYPYNGTYCSESGSQVCGVNIIEFSDVDLTK